MAMKNSTRACLRGLKSRGTGQPAETTPNLHKTPPITVPAVSSPFHQKDLGRAARTESQYSSGPQNGPHFLNSPFLLTTSTRSELLSAWSDTSNSCLSAYPAKSSPALT